MHQPLFEHFVAGYFAVNSVGLQFSKIAFDQKHEHNNKEVKSSSGYINLANKEDLDFLRKLEIALPEMHSYLEEIEGKSKALQHKECSTAFTLC